MMTLLPDLLLMAGLGGFSAGLLVFAAKRFIHRESRLVTLVNSTLPQTQCAQCGYPGCRPYAEAILQGEAINLCPPGGEQTIAELAELLGRGLPASGDHQDAHKPPGLAVIRESECIGCTLCIAACPVDAIIGAPQMMHTVVKAICTGCDLCREPCPVDCIDLITPQAETTNLTFPEAANACINCGYCVDVCPKALQPQWLYRYRHKPRHIDTYKLDDCIECGLCDRVCPAELPLTAAFQASKALKKNLALERQTNALAEQRYLAREARLAASNNKLATRPSADDRQRLLAALQDES